MNCMKCGKEIPDGQVFCPECLSDMSKYPVARDAYVQLPRRPAKAVEKKAKDVPLPEQISHLKKWIRRLIAIIGVLLLVIAAFTFVLLHRLETDDSKAPIGRNYTTSPQSFR